MVKSSKIVCDYCIYMECVCKISYANV